MGFDLCGLLVRVVLGHVYFDACYVSVDLVFVVCCFDLVVIVIRYFVCLIVVDFAF